MGHGVDAFAGIRYNFGMFPLNPMSLVRDTEFVGVETLLVVPVSVT